MSKIFGTFTTKAGTVINLIDLKGKAYMMASDRIRWFTEENPMFNIETNFLALTDEQTVAQVTVTLPDPNDKARFLRRASGVKRETKSDFSDHTEKAVTGALARALSYLGYGTQYAADELDEGNRLADAPVEVRHGSGTFSNPVHAVTTSGTVVTKEDVLAAKSATKELEDLPPVSPNPDQEAVPTDTPSFQTKRRQRENLKTKRDF